MNGVGPHSESNAYAGRPEMAELVQALSPTGSFPWIDAEGSEMQVCTALPQTRIQKIDLLLGL